MQEGVKGCWGKGWEMLRWVRMENVLAKREGNEWKGE